MSASVKDVLTRTKARLETKGWVKKEWGSADGPNCLVGAIEAEARAVAQTAVLAVCQANQLKSPFDLNDAPETKLEDVLAAIDRAIEAA